MGNTHALACCTQDQAALCDFSHQDSSNFTSNRKREDSPGLEGRSTIVNNEKKCGGQQGGGAIGQDSDRAGESTNRTNRFVGDYTDWVEKIHDDDWLVVGKDDDDKNDTSVDVRSS